MCDQSSGTSGCSLNREGNCFWPSGKMVYNGHEMVVFAGSWEWPHQIYIDEVETAMRELECHEWSPDESLNHRSLARDTGFRPDTNLLAETMPNIFFSHEFLCGT